MFDNGPRPAPCCPGRKNGLRGGLSCAVRSKVDEVDCRANFCHEFEAARFPGRGASLALSYDYRRRPDRGTNCPAKHSAPRTGRSG